jgi:hypothetical protein
MVIAVRHETPSHITTMVMSVVLMVLVVFWPVAKRKVTEKPMLALGAPGGVKHNLLLLAEVMHARRGL